MLSKKIFLSAALVSMAGFVACGDDSSSSASDGTLPEKVKTIQEANSLKCDESVKCAKVFVEEEIVNDYFQCDGSQWFPATDAKFKDLCPAKAEGEEKGESEGDKTPESSASEAGSTDSGAASSESGAASTDSNADSADSNENSSDSAVASSESGATSTNSGSGKMVSCTTTEGVMAGCDEAPEDSDLGKSYIAQCESLLGGTLGTGCAK